MIRTLGSGLVALLLSLMLTSCGSEDDPGATSECRYPDSGSSARPVEKPDAVPDDLASETLSLQTSAGDIPITLDPDAAPCTVNSFVSLANQRYFDDTPCHRLAFSRGSFAILQCGDPTGTGQGGPGYRFADELDGDDARLQNCATDPDGVARCDFAPGLIAMANSGPDTNGSQFFLVFETSRFPAAYTVFGQTDASGLKVLRSIGRRGTASGEPDGTPKTPVTIRTIR